MIGISSKNCEVKKNVEANLRMVKFPTSAMCLKNK